jgi:hypothetical protein
VIGGWRKLHNEGLHDLFTSPNIIGNQMETEMCGACSTNGNDEKCLQNFIREGKPERKRDHLENIGIDGKIMLY